MKTILELLPIELSNSQVEFIRNNFIFYFNNLQNINLGNLIKKLDEEIEKQLKYFIDNNISLDDATSEQINRFRILFNNILLLNNIDYIDEFNLTIRGLEKWLILDKQLGAGAEGSVYSVSIKFKNLTSPKLVLKKIRNNDDSLPNALLKEFLNYLIIGKLTEYSPNFISTLGLVICNSNKGIDIDNNKSLCSCIGTLNCVKKNYMISIPYNGDTFEKSIEKKVLDIFNSNPDLFFSQILKQLVYSLKIAQEKFKFLHNDLNDRNISLTIYDKPKTLTYKFENGEIKKIQSKYKINIFDFGATKFTDLEKLKIVDKKFYDTYNNLFNSPNIVVDLIKRLNTMRQNDHEYESISKTIYDYSNIKATGMSYKDAIDLGMYLNSDLSNRFILIQLFGEDVANNVLETVSSFDEMKDYKNFIDKIENIMLDSLIKTSLTRHKNEISRLTTINDLINLFDPIEVSIHSKIKNILDNFLLQNIVPIINPLNRIDIDGYDSSKLYGKNPNFNYNMISKSYEFYNLYGDIDSKKCKKDGIDKVIYSGNPGYAKFFHPNEPINWEDKLISELPHPANIGEIFSYTYSFVIDKYTKKFSVRYGRLLDITEIGSNHVIISYNDKIIVAGEIGIKKIQEQIFKYYININSSKMNDVFSSININNRKNNDENTTNFYYILMINLAYKLFREIEIQEFKNNIEIAPGFNIKYSKPYEGIQNQGDKIVAYYDTNVCPSDEYISKYNEFGLRNKIKNACIGYKNPSGIDNMKQIENKIVCNWDNIVSNVESTNNYYGGVQQINYYDKYIKYKLKYLKLKNVGQNL